MNRKIWIGILAALVLVGLVVFAFVLRGKGEGEFTAAGPSPAATPVMGDALAQLADENCSTNPGEPKLQGGQYKGYEIQKADGDFTERVTLEDGTKLEIFSTGCEEFVTTRLVFQSTVDAKAKSVEQWARWADERVIELKTAEGADWIKSEFHDFVQRAEEIKATGELTSHDSIRICNDGSLPSVESDCTWDEGGSTEFKVETKDGVTQVIIEFVMAS